MRARDVKGTKAAKIIEQNGRVLPKTVQIAWVLEPSEDPWLSVEEEILQHAEKDEIRYVGEYRLVRIRKVSLNLNVENFFN
jgi:hypothetical protein